MTDAPSERRYIGTWVGVDRFGMIRSAHAFTAERGSEDDAYAFLKPTRLRLVRLSATFIRLGSNLSEYAAAGVSVLSQDAEAT